MMLSLLTPSHFSESGTLDFLVSAAAAKEEKCQSLTQGRGLSMKFNVQDGSEREGMASEEPVCHLNMRNERSR